MKPAHRLRSLTFAAAAVAFFPARAAAGPLFAKQRLDPCFYPEGAAVADFNGDCKPDLAIANKKGVFVFVQRRP